MKSNPLLPLLAELKVCRSRDNALSAQRLSESWERFRNQALAENKPTTAIMAALVLDDPAFAQLLTTAEHTQLIALTKSAIERYQQKTNPPNKLGKLIAASIKESK